MKSCKKKIIKKGRYAIKMLVLMVEVENHVVWIALWCPNQTFRTKQCFCKNATYGIYCKKHHQYLVYRIGSISAFLY